jgi:hypothetical protein
MIVRALTGRSLSKIAHSRSPLTNFKSKHNAGAPLGKRRAVVDLLFTLSKKSEAPSAIGAASARQEASRQDVSRQYVPGTIRNTIHVRLPIQRGAGQDSKMSEVVLHDSDELPWSIVCGRLPALMS